LNICNSLLPHIYHKLYIFLCSFELGPEDLPKKNGASPVLRIMSLGHSLSAFVNGQYIGKLLNGNCECLSEWVSGDDNYIFDLK
jgi:hypothetical protein